MMKDLHSPPSAVARMTITFNSFVVPCTEINFDIVWTTSAIRSTHFLLMAGLWLDVLLLVTTLYIQEHQYQKSWYSKGRLTFMLMITTMFPNHLMASCLGLSQFITLKDTLRVNSNPLYTMKFIRHDQSRAWTSTDISHPLQDRQKNQLNEFARWVLCNMQS